MKEKLSTVKLMKLIRKSEDITTSLSKNTESINNPTVVDYFKQLLKQHNCTIPTVILKSNLSKSFVYQIFNGTRMAGRDVLLRIAFAIGLDVDETQRLLSIANKGALYPRIRRDAVIIFSLQKHYDLNKACELLDSVGEQPLL